MGKFTVISKNPFLDVTEKFPNDSKITDMPPYSEVDKPPASKQENFQAYATEPSNLKT